MSKYGHRPHNWFEAIVNKLGGEGRAEQLLRGELVITENVPSERLSAWRTFLIGGVSAKNLLARVRAGFAVNDWAQDLMKQKAFTTLPAEEEIETIVLTPEDFGYERTPMTGELLDPVRLEEWSKQNAHRLPEGYAVELLPAEAGPHIRDQYKDQPRGEILWIAMEQITGSDGGPGVFDVERRGDGGQWLGAHWASPGGRWRLGHRLVFRLRKVTQD